MVGYAILAISADGLFLASASQDSTVKLWTIRGVPVETLGGHSDDVWSVAFHPNQLQLITGSSDQQVGIWRIALPQNPGIVESNVGLRLSGFAAQADGGRHMVFNAQGTVHVIDTEANQVLFARTQEASFSAAALSPNGTLLATANEDGSISIYDVDSNDALATLEGHDMLISSLVFTADNTGLVSSDQRGNMKRWDVTTYENIDTRLERTDGSGITAMAVSSDGQYLAVASRDTAITIWDVSSEEIVATLIGHEDAIDTLIFDLDNTRLISGGRDADIIIWDFLGDEPLERHLMGHVGIIADLAVSPNGAYLASAGRDNAVILWDLETSRQVGLPFVGHQQPVAGVDFRDDDTLISIGQEGDIIRWDLGIDYLIGVACQMSNRNLTELEWSQFIQIEAYQTTCQ